MVIQVSHLVGKIKEESEGDTESATRKELHEKISTLSQSRFPYATDVLAMIWNGIMGPLDLPTLEPEPSSLLNTLPFLNWHRVKVALLQSITTGIFIDIQFFAYNAINDGLPVDPRPLYVSSIATQRWGPAITTRKPEPSSEPA